jgi:16S rRNA G966 N2-methylase RsmD
MDMTTEELMDIKINPKRLTQKKALIQYADSKYPVANLFPMVEGTPMFALRASPEGLYSISRPNVSLEILDQIKKQYESLGYPFHKIRVMDATANNGGDTIRFGLDKDISHVFSIEMDPQNFHILQHNVRLYEPLRRKIELIHGNMMEYIDQKEYDILYVDPPWGGVDRVWEDHLTLHLSSGNYREENEVFRMIASKPHPWKLCAVKVPATMKNSWIIQQVRNSFASVSVKVVTISPVTTHKCGVKLVLITKALGGTKRRTKRSIHRKIDKSSSFYHR